MIPHLYLERKDLKYQTVFFECFSEQIPKRIGCAINIHRIPDDMYWFRREIRIICGVFKERNLAGDIAVVLLVPTYVSFIDQCPVDVFRHLRISKLDCLRYLIYTFYTTLKRKLQRFCVRRNLITIIGAGIGVTIVFLRELRRRSITEL